MVDKNVKVSQLMTRKVLTLHHSSYKKRLPRFLKIMICTTFQLQIKNKVKGMLSKMEYYKLLYGFTYFKARIAEKFNTDFLRLSRLEMLLPQLLPYFIPTILWNKQ
ncbi:MAG: hypothetical protein ACJAVF_004656 [Paraglaciecola sp.]|jgi:hypothetical protein